MCMRSAQIIIPVRPLPALQCTTTILRPSASNHCSAFSQKSVIILNEGVYKTQPQFRTPFSHYLMISKRETGHFTSEALSIVCLLFTQIVHPVMIWMLQIQEAYNLRTRIAKQPYNVIITSWIGNVPTLSPFCWVSHGNDTIRHVTQVQIESIFSIPSPILGHHS